MDPNKIEPALVLVVDDDVRTARLLVRMLREDGFEVELATNGAAAIGRLTRAPIPDVLVTDLRMPEADGISVARYARSRRPSIPVLVVTGYPNMAAADAPSLDPPAIVHTKPLDYRALVGDLRAATCATSSARTSTPAG